MTETEMVMAKDGGGHGNQMRRKQRKRSNGKVNVG